MPTSRGRRRRRGKIPLPPYGACDLGLKGCTTFRPNAITGEALSVDCGLPAR